MQEFSIIILCETRRHLVSSTLDSLKSQQGSFEVIVLDRDPAARDLPTSYPELNIRVTPIEKSLPKAMNRALKMAGGSYVQFLQAGDRYISEHGMAFLSEMATQKPPYISSREFFWLSKEKALSIGGFDETLHFVPLEEMLYRFEAAGFKPLICPRVLIDAGTKPVISVREKCRIIYRYFGWKRALHWVFFERRSQILQELKVTLKRSIGRRE